MRYGTVCSGIEAASVAWEPLGWKPAWFSEIEPFPCAVLAHHWPSVPNLGDMTGVQERILAREVEAPDVLAGGTPCQAFSVAGKRGSLSDDRGNLSLTFCEIADAIDDVRRADGKPASIVFWENVPGILSTADNAFGCFLARLAGSDRPVEPGPRPERGRASFHWRWKKDTGEHVARWPDAGVVAGPRRTVAWRVLDAQYFGLAQRRRRVFVVASARNGINPAEILFEREGVRRDSAPERGEGESVAALTANGVGTCGADDNQGQAGHLLPCWWDGGAVSQTLDAVLAKGQTMPEKNRFPAVLQVAALLEVGKRTGVSTTDKRAGIGIGDAGDPMYTLQAGAQHGVAIVAFNARQDPSSSEHVFGALGCSSPQAEAVAYGFQPRIARNGRGDMGDLCHALSAQAGETGKGDSAPCVAYVGDAVAVRRITPVEAERLQGMPDNHTRVPYRGKPAADGPRYKAIGNSWAVHCARWIGARIDAAVREVA